MDSALTIQELITMRGTGSADRIGYAVGREGGVLRYRDLARQYAAWTVQLTAGDVGPGHRAGLLTGDPLAFAGAYLSLVAVGITVVPLNPESTPEDARAQLALLGVDLLLTDREDLSHLPCPVWHLQGGTLQPGDGPQAPPPGGPAPAVLLTSSGTSGTPKVVPLTERQLLYVAQRIVVHHGLGPLDRGYSPLPLFHVNAQVVGLISTLVAGSSLVLDRKFRRTGFWELLDSWGVTWCNTVPAILAILADSPAPDARTVARLRFARTASAPLPAAVQSRFESRSGVSVLETYGMSEAASQITANPLPGSERRQGSVGLPVGVLVRVVDEQRRTCEPGEVGSIEIRGPSVVHEYVMPGPDEHRRPARTADGWLVTGDIGYQDADGFLTHTGRADDVINRGGEKVYPREIEEVLRSHASVVEAVAVGQADQILGECPVAYVVARDGADPAGLAAELQSLCADRLVRAKRPARLAVVDTLPKGPTGKVSRRRLADARAITEVPARAS